MKLLLRLLRRHIVPRRRRVQVLLFGELLLLLLLQKHLLLLQHVLVLRRFYEQILIALQHRHAVGLRVGEQLAGVYKQQLLRMMALKATLCRGLLQQQLLLLQLPQQLLVVQQNRFQRVRALEGYAERALTAAICCCCCCRSAGNMLERSIDSGVLRQIRSTQTVAFTVGEAPKRRPVLLLQLLLLLLLHLWMY